VRDVRCLVPECDGLLKCRHAKEGLWARYYMDAPLDVFLSLVKEKDTIHNSAAEMARFTESVFT